MAANAPIWRYWVAGERALASRHPPRRRAVDLLRWTITVVEQVQYVGGQHLVLPPKSAAGRRSVAVPAVVTAALEDHLGHFGEPGVDGLLFPAPQGGFLRLENFRRRVWRPAVAEAGVAPLRIHDLRHTAGTLAARTGATTKELMARLGHASAAASLIYQHAAQDRDRRIAACLDEMAAEVAGPSTGSGLEQ